MRATSETLAPGSSDAATSRSFSSCDHRRRRSTDVITSAREIVIALLLGLPLGPAALASLKQDGLWRRDTFVRSAVPVQSAGKRLDAANTHQRPLTTSLLTRAGHSNRVMVRDAAANRRGASELAEPPGQLVE